MKRLKWLEYIKSWKKQDPLYFLKCTKYLVYIKEYITPETDGQPEKCYPKKIIIYANNIPDVYWLLECKCQIQYRGVICLCKKKNDKNGISRSVDAPFWWRGRIYDAEGEE